MKILSLSILLVLLASCAGNEIEKSKETASEEINVVEIVESDDDLETPEEVVVVEETVIEEPTLVEEEEEEEETVTVSEEDAITETANDISTELKTLDADYTNPKGLVDMEISYNLNSEGKIEQITTTATTYDLTEFNGGIQSVVGKTVEEASEMYFSGSSLTTDAFQKAMKSELD